MYEGVMKPFFFGLLRFRMCPVPTWRGWLLFFLVVTPVALFGVNHVHSFLAVNDPLEGGILVIEGWSPDYAFADAITEFKRHSFDKLYVVGGPIERGVPLSEYRTYAELGSAMLLRMGMKPESVLAVPAKRVRKDRTYASALALSDLLRNENRNPKVINLISTGLHARRSRLMFQKAFGSGTKIGIIAMQDQNYNPARWWEYSQGVRSVIDELLAYIYARLFFSPVGG